jgi:hypothetical protein
MTTVALRDLLECLQSMLPGYGASPAIQMEVEEVNQSPKSPTPKQSDTEE